MNRSHIRDQACVCLDEERLPGQVVRQSCVCGGLALR